MEDSLTTSAPPKPQIAPDLERGAVALAERLMPPDQERLEHAQALQRAEQRFKEGRVRIETTKAQLENAGDAIRTAVGPERTKLAKERAVLVAELDCAPEDIEALARGYMDALRAWAPRVIDPAKVCCHRLGKEHAALRRERAPLAQAERDGKGPNPKSAELFDRVQAKQREYDDMCSLLRMTRNAFDGKFGCEHGRYTEGQVEQWIDRQRREVSRETPVAAQIRNSLRPLSMGGA
jgi:hypothetical protein